MKAMPAVAAIAVVTALPAVAQEHSFAPAGYALVWADEFDTPGLPDETKWTYDREANKTGWYNNELQYYAAGRLKTTRVVDGALTIAGRKEKLDRAADYGGQRYSSARLITRGKAEWTYGHFEVRAKLPCGQGTWPAFWMLGPDTIPWPENGEIDIFEQVGEKPDSIFGTIHTRTTPPSGDGSATKVATACADFHTYHATWTPEEIAIGVDGHVYHTYRKAGVATGGWPFDTPHYLLLNLAIGGDMAGKVDDSIFPVRFTVDFVRVFQAM